MGGTGLRPFALALARMISSARPNCARQPAFESAADEALHPAKTVSDKDQLSAVSGSTAVQLRRVRTAFKRSAASCSAHAKSIMQMVSWVLSSAARCCACSILRSSYVAGLYP